MKALIFFLSLVTLSHARTYKGFAEIDRVVKGRLIVPSLSYSVTQKALPNPLNQLLGAYAQNNDLGTTLINADPNALNTLLWYVVAHTFSIDVAMTCNEPENYKKVFREDFYNLVLGACSITSADPVDAEFLEELWIHLVLFDAPEIEFMEWRDFILRHYSLANGKEVLKAAVTTAFMNPYFLTNP